MSRTSKFGHAAPSSRYRVTLMTHNHGSKSRRQPSAPVPDRLSAKKRPVTSARAGKIGRMYCGNCDFENEKKISGRSAHNARNRLVSSLRFRHMSLAAFGNKVIQGKK